MPAPDPDGMTFPRLLIACGRTRRPSSDPREGPASGAVDLGVAAEVRASPVASPRRDSSATCISRSSATTGRGCGR
jgi:hypothetical protein